MMRLVLLALVAVSFGCSVANDTDDQQQDQAQTEPASAEAAMVDDQLPEMTILRVPLDANGNEISTGIELRSIQSGAALVDANGDAIAQAFAGAAVHAGAVDELDHDTSAQSWSFTRAQAYGVGSQDPVQGNQDDQYDPGLGQDDQDPYDQGQGGQGQYNPGQGGQGQYNPGQGGQGQYNPGQGGQGQYNPGQGGQGQYQDRRLEGQTSVEHVPGTRRSIYPVKRKAIFQHNTTDVYPQEKIDIYPVETVRIHPTQRSVQVHPLQRHVNYVNPCVRTGCNGAQFSNYWPTVYSQGYNQFYHYTNHYNRGGYRYYKFCKPRFFIQNHYSRFAY